MPDAPDDIHTDIRYAPYAPLELIETGALADQYARQRTVVLIVEPASVMPTGDA